MIFSGAIMWPNLIHLRTSAIFPYSDASQMIWANGWVAHALTHFENPFFSPYLMTPHGANLLAAPCTVGLAILFAPLTLLLNPVSSFNLQMLLMPVTSALAMVVLLRQLTVSRYARFVGGLVWGFSPYVLSSLNTGWTNVGYAFFPPLAVALLLDELHFRTRSSFRNGAYLALLVAFQITVGSELAASSLFFMALIGGPIVGWSLLRSPQFRQAMRSRITRFVVGFGLPTILLTFPMAVFALRGPSHLRSWVWDAWVLKSQSLHSVSQFVGDRLSSTNPFLKPMAATAHYLGWTLLVLLVPAIWLAVRSQWGSLAITSGLVAVWLSFGDHVPFSLWHVLWRLPVVHNMAASRYVLWMWFAIAIVFALAFERLLLSSWPRAGRILIATGVSVVLLVSYVTTFRDVLPANHTRVIPGKELAYIPRSSPPPIVITFPFPAAGPLMIDQAANGFFFRSPAEFGPAWLTLPAEERWFLGYFGDFALFGGMHTPKDSAALRTRLRAAMAKLKVDYVVVPIRLAQPIAGHADVVPSQVRMITLLGMPEIKRDVFMWDLRRINPPTHQVPVLRVLFCLEHFDKHRRGLPACLLS